MGINNPCPIYPYRIAGIRTVLLHNFRAVHEGLLDMVEVMRQKPLRKVTLLFYSVFWMRVIYHGPTQVAK